MILTYSLLLISILHRIRLDLSLNTMFARNYEQPYNILYNVETLLFVKKESQHNVSIIQRDLSVYVEQRRTQFWTCRCRRISLNE